MVQDNRKLAPVQNISIWKFIIVGNYYRNAPIMYGVADPSSVDLITSDVEAISAPPEPFFVRERWTLREYVHKTVIAP